MYYTPHLEFSPSSEWVYVEKVDISNYMSIHLFSSNLEIEPTTLRKGFIICQLQLSLA